MDSKRLLLKIVKNNLKLLQKNLFLYRLEQIQINYFKKDLVVLAGYR